MSDTLLPPFPHVQNEPTMPESHPADKIPLMIHLSPDVAARLKQAAEAQRHSPADFVADLLGRHLPRPQTGGPKKGSIPYS
jgi:hypothetical protein